VDPALQELFAEGAADDEVAVILRLADNGTPPEGVRIVARFGQIATCRLRRGDIPHIRAIDVVRSMKAAHLFGPTPVIDEADDKELDESDDPEATEFRVDGGDLFGDEPDHDALPGDQRRPAGDLPSGRGVVVAHIDWGVDFVHPDFRDEHGRTRLLALWDQGKAMDADRPNRYGYGRIHVTADIDRALAAGKPYAALGYHPADSDTGTGSHGTHTLGISAGNGRAGGPVGLAPQAHLVFVHLSTYTADGPARLGDSVALLEAFDFIASVADGRPVVINASIGKQAGEHDGKTLVEQGMDAFLLGAPGRAIVLSTGNYFKRDSHAQGLLRPGESHTLHLIADSERRTPTEVDLWYPGVDRLTIIVRGPDGLAEVKAGPGEKAAIVVDGREIGRLYHRVGDPNNGDNEVTLFLYHVAPPARWDIVLVGDDVADGRFHTWIERDGICAGCQAHFTSADSEPTGTTGTIANGLRTVAVGAYNAHRQERPLARFSSCGPTRDGRQKPDVVAPGVKVLAARSTPRDAGTDAPLLTRMSGTSMAAPHVTGTIALMFEAAGRPLYIEETRRLLLGNSEPLATDADAIDRMRIGSGFLDTAAAIAATRKIGPIGHAGIALPIEDNQDGRKTIMSETSGGTTGEAGTEAGTEANGEKNGETSGGMQSPEAREMQAMQQAVSDNIESPDSAERSSRDRSSTYEPAPLPFQVQLPIGGGAPAVALPIGGAGSPLAFTLPLGSPAPAPAPATATAPAAGPAVPTAPASPSLSALEPIKVASPDFPLYVPPTENMWAEAGEPGARPLIRRGSRGPSVQEAQQKLNIVHRRQQESGSAGLAAAPLVEDGIFGDHTYQATVSFQRLAFPDQPREWDGAIGPKTWAMLDQMSASQQPPVPPTPQPVDPNIIPVVGEGCGNLIVWLNAFIPQNVPGYTFTVPGGSHAGKTAIPCPTAVASLANPNCFRLGYLTDQRSFNNVSTASVRMRSLAEIQVTPARLVRTVHETSGTTEINRNTGAVTCSQLANMSRCSFSGFGSSPMPLPPGDFVITLKVKGAASDPCVNLAADIDYVGDIEILCSPSRGLIEVGFSGKVDSFPAFEMYASLGGVTKTLFTLPPPAGNTVVNLLGGASTPVAGKVSFNCTFGGASVGEPAQSVEAYWASPETESEYASNYASEYATASETYPEVEAHECHCGERVLAVAEAYAQSPALRPASSAAFVESLLDAGGGEAVIEASDENATAALHGLPMSPTALFHAFAYSDHPLRPRGALQRQYARRFELLARPGDRLGGIAPRTGDLLIRIARGEGWGNVAVIATPGLQPFDRLATAGLRAEGGERPLPGSYVHVVEILPSAKPSSAGFARRLADTASLVLGDTLLLRPRGVFAPAEATEIAEAGCDCGPAAIVGRRSESENYYGEGDPAVAAPPCTTLDHFARDSDHLLPRHRTQIDDVARAILSGGISSVAVTGFASTDGSNAHNLALGMRRADRVAQALRSSLEHLRAGSSSGVAIAVRSRGEDEQVAGGSVVLNRRVTICPAAPAPRPDVVPVRQRVFRVTAKSFIGPIGSHVGSLDCGIDTPLGHVPSPLTGPALRAFAAATDLAFSEDPRSDNIFIVPPPDNKGYRLFSSVRVQIEHRGDELLSATPIGGILTDSGKECAPGVSVCLQAPPLSIDRPFSATRIDAHRMRLTWGVKGRPPTVTDSAFNAICIRTSVFIWHQIKATVDCSSGAPVFTSLVVEGSRFPSHRLWLDGAQVFQVRQGPFSALWDAEPGDPTRVH
jgi:subtilisin family serine protease